MARLATSALAAPEPSASPATPGPATSRREMPGRAVSPAGLTAESDGRRLRREQNRQAVIDALLALFESGRYQPSCAEIAAKAGLSPRSLFRYFDDVDDLHRAAADRQIRLALPLLQLRVGPHDPVPDKIEGIVQSRVQVFERVAPAARALRAAATRNELMAAQLARIREFLRQQLSELFAAELASRDAAVLPAIDVLCSFESYDLLRRESGLSPSATAATLVAALTALLNGDRDVS